MTDTTDKSRDQILSAIATINIANPTDIEAFENLWAGYDSDEVIIPALLWLLNDLRRVPGVDQHLAHLRTTLVAERGSDG